MGNINPIVEEKVDEIITSFTYQFNNESWQEFCEREADLKERLWNLVHNFLVEEDLK